MYQLKYHNSEYLDFKLTNDKTSTKNLDDFLQVDIDFTSSLISNVGNDISEDVDLDDITLNGLDNFLIPNGLIDGSIDPNIVYQVESGDKFLLTAVSGYTKNLDYTIRNLGNKIKLDGGFYQGFFKIHEYPVEYFDLSVSRGWTVNMTLFHNPTTTVNSLNNVFENNKGFIFYIGARAENKYNDITELESDILKNDYLVDFGPSGTTYYTYGGEFTLDGVDYVGNYNKLDGKFYTEYVYSEKSLKLTRNYDYSDLLNNAFGVRIHPDGRIGYRLITSLDCEDLAVTGSTGNPTGSTVYNSWVYDECTNKNTLLTEKYKVIEEYSKIPVFTNSRLNKYANISIVFERYYPVNSKCELSHSKFRKGTLKIFVNGIKVLSAKNVDEVFARELDTQKELQQGVPYVISIGGGTQGLYEAVYLDPNKEIDGVLEKYFAGTYTGSLVNFSFYNTPANVTMIRNKTKTTLSELGITISFGGIKTILY